MARKGASLYDLDLDFEEQRFGTFQSPKNDSCFMRAVEILEKCSSSRPTGCNKCDKLDKCLLLFSGLSDRCCDSQLKPTDLTAFNQKFSQLKS